MNSEPLPNAADLRKRFGISAATLRRWIIKGVIPQPLSLGRKRVWPADIYSRIETQQNNSTDRAETINKA